jgi:hypothetical protein
MAGCKLTLIHRLGAWAASFRQRWRALEKRRLGARAGGRRLFVRCAFRLGDLLILGGLLLVAGWVVLPVLLLAGFIQLIIRTLAIDPWPESPTYDQVDHPGHRNHWPERYDEWGDLK